MQKKIHRRNWIKIGLLSLLGVIVGLPLLGVVFQHIATALDRSAYPMPGKRIGLDDTTLHIYCSGPEESENTIVIDVGAGNWSLHWADLQDDMANQTRVCSYDRVGWGWSDGGPLEPRVGAKHAQQLHDLLMRAGETPPYVMIGHSYGGYLNRLYHKQFPDDVSAIVLVEAAHEDQWSRIPALTALIMNEGVANMKTAEAISRFGLLRFFDLPSQGVSKHPDRTKAVDDAAKTAKYYVAFQSEMLGAQGIAKEVRESGSVGDTPLLVISGGRSAYAYCHDELGLPCRETQDAWHAMQEELAELSTNSTHLVLPEATHAIQLEQPDAIVKAILDFERHHVRRAK